MKLFLRVVLVVSILLSCLFGENKMYIEWQKKKALELKELENKWDFEVLAKKKVSEMTKEEFEAEARRLYLLNYGKSESSMTLDELRPYEKYMNAKRPEGVGFTREVASIAAKLGRIKDKFGGSIDKYLKRMNEPREDNTASFFLGMIILVLAFVLGGMRVRDAIFRR